MTPRRKATIALNIDRAAFVCVDDYGEEVWRCHFTQQLVWISKAFLAGALLPQSNAIYVCADGYLPYYKQSRMLFNQSERNCNTCKHLIRVPFKKTNSGLQPGKCNNPHIDIPGHPYWNRHRTDTFKQWLFERGIKEDGDFYFAPDDCMNMTCYEYRD